MLILVRHGESVANAQGLLLGRTDAELTDTGRRPGARARGRCCTDPVAEVRSSPLRRARDTAELLALGPPVAVDERWIEVDYGEFECQPLGGIPAEVWQRWQRDRDFRPEGGETLAEVDRRIAAACEELFAADGAGARRADGDVVVVSHVQPDQGGGGLGARDRRPLLAPPPAHGVGDPHRMEPRRADPARLQRGGVGTPRPRAPQSPGA